MSVVIETEEKLYTIPEFLALDFSDDDDEDYELIGGQIVAIQSHTSGKHAAIVTRVSTKLDLFAGAEAGEKRLGTVFMAPSCTLAKPDGYDYPKPDVCFVLADRLPAKFDGPIPVAPDLVVEVWSPSDTEEIQYKKRQAYQAAGVPLIWFVHMLEQYVLIHRLDHPMQAVDFDGELTGEPVLPGFRVPIKSLFE